MVKKPNQPGPPRKKRRRFPMEFWAGGSQIRILRDPQKIPIKPRAADPLDQATKKRRKKPGKKFRRYDSYLVEYYDGSKRIRLRRASFQKAMGLVETLKIKFLNGKVDALQLEGRDQHIYLSAVEQLKGLGLTLDQAVGEYVKAANRLRAHGLTVVGMAHEVEALSKRLGGVPLSTAVDFFEKHGAKGKAGKMVPEIVAEHLDGLRKDKKTAYHIRDTKLRLERFAKKFPGPILEVSTRAINEWLRGMKSLECNHEGEEISGRTRNNLRGAVVQLFNFARENGYLPMDLRTAADATKKVKEVGGDNEVFTPVELEKMLTQPPRVASSPYGDQGLCRSAH